MRKIHIVLFSILIASVVGSAIASITVGWLERKSTCDDQSFLPLSSWLCLNATFNIIFLIIFELLLILFWRDYKHIYVLILGTVIGFVFLIIFNIIGSFALFRYSPVCKTQDPSLYFCTLANLIFGWLLYLICAGWLLFFRLYLCCVVH